MSRLTSQQDAYGHALLDYHEGRRGGSPIVERDDGMVGVDSGVPGFFEEIWSGPDHQALKLARGRVLDVGAGAGRVALHLQKKGQEVVAIDNSPLAVRVLKARGVKKSYVMPFKELNPKLGRFDSIAMWGGNFGLFGRASGMRAMLRRLKRLTNTGARIIAQTVDIYREPVPPEDAAYFRFNRSRGRMSGELRIRILYKKFRTPWFDYFMASPDEMAGIADGTGWLLERVINFPNWTSPVYFGVLAKET